MIDRLPVQDGTILDLHPDVRAAQMLTGYTLASAGRHIAVESDTDGSLSTAAAAALRAGGWTACVGTSMFASPELCRALFDHAADPEVAGLRGCIGPPSAGRGLDVGCGTGRLLLPLLRAGYTVDGVDASTQLVADVAARLPGTDAARIYCASIEEFRSPGAYAFAYAAMNTVRYLVTQTALCRHFAAVAASLSPGGRYWMSISLNANPTPRTARIARWEVLWRGQAHRVEWDWYDYCHVRRRIFERIRLFHITSGRLVHEEYQVQGNYTRDDLVNAFRAADPPLQLESVYDQRFKPVRVDGETTGTFWFALRRT